MALQEIWKDIKGYEGLYQISSLGRVKSLPKKSGFLTLKERIMKPFIKNNGYCSLRLFKNQEIETVYVHRLVAETFINNPNNYPCVNHKNYIKNDNRVSNLEWCTYSMNNTYSNCQIIAGASKRIPIAQYTKTGTFIRFWESATKAGKELNIPNTNITACCRGRVKSAYGFKWQYI